MTPVIKDLKKHELLCQFKRQIVQYGKGKNKTPLAEVKDRQSCKNNRLKQYFDFLETQSKQDKENKTDILFFMLHTELWNLGERDKAKQLENLWTNKNLASLTTEQCLALRVETLMTKGQYKMQYGLFDQTLNNNVLKPSSQLDEIEQKFMPGSTEF